MFTTVEEAQSATDTDVEMYLTKLKSDLIVGEPGYPKVITIACDQQIYALIVNMKKRYLNRFDWVLAVHGDWHCLSLTAEILQDLLWDGGLRQLTELCGYKHQLTQWQELHLMLTALYEALLRKAVKEYRATNQPRQNDGFWKWITQTSTDTNQDQISRVWATTLCQLHTYVGYFFSIRSGNWMLRNSCIKGITPLFFCFLP